MKKIIHTEKAPAAIGTYNQAILTGNLLFTSGQIAINPLTGKLVDGDAKPQTEMIFKNIMINTSTTRQYIMEQWN